MTVTGATVMNSYDLIVIGGGPAGITAALYGGRARLKTALVEKGAPGGLMLLTDNIENYPGFTSISGTELTSKMIESLNQFQVDRIYDEVTGLKRNCDEWKVITTDHVLSASAVIIATGSRPRQLGIKGEERLRGKGVSYCAVCDGAFFEDQQVVVVGGGDSAVQEALFLTQYAKGVNVIHRRDLLRAEASLIERAMENQKVSFTWNSRVVEITGSDCVEGVLLEDLGSGAKTSIPCSAVFIYIGNLPDCKFAAEFLLLSEEGFIIADDELGTGQPGLFACGDVRKKHLRQISTAVGDGALAAMTAVQYIKKYKK